MGGVVNSARFQCHRPRVLIVRNLLIFLLIIGAVWWLRRALARPRRGRAQEAADERAGDAQPPAGPERMLSCAHCGVHVPESEGVRADGRFFCCEAHRREGEAGRER